MWTRIWESHRAAMSPSTHWVRPRPARATAMYARPKPASSLRSRPRHPRGDSARSGLTMVELMIAVVILTLCCGMLTSTISATNLHRTANAERAVAAEAARGVVEDMHNWNFGAVYTTYNDDPTDDPDGEGTAPGRHFHVEGLVAASDDADGHVGEIIMPSSGAELLENETNEGLGMPRDLNGDMKIDGEDHVLDHIVLPVRVVVRWEGKGGSRTFELFTMLADLEKAQ